MSFNTRPAPWMINGISSRLNEYRNESVEPIWSISVTLDVYESTLRAVIIHKDSSSSCPIHARTEEELQEKVQNYLDPWRQYQEAE